MQTPGDELDLVRGLLYSEDIYRSKEVEPEMQLECDDAKNQTFVHVIAQEADLKKGYANSRQLLSVASCGICGRVEMKTLEGQVFNQELLSTELIVSLLPAMRKHQQLFELTGGCHGIAAFSKEGKLLIVKEDIGRHNAVDKVIGHLLRNKKLNEAHFLTISGRISYEIVAKAFMAGIPTLVSVSAPSSLAVDLAKEFGMRLIAFCREDRLTLYS
jgi:FdhD protein